jgi:hypothetical protein
MFRIAGVPRAMITALLWSLASSALAAENDTWSVSKSSGDVWITTTSADAVSLKQEDVLKPGDTIRTGRSGRVLLVRGEETILIAPNSVIGLPTEKKDGLSTTILQQAGSILLDVEKRNVKHFEVETPYLAAVVKGTQFAVTVNAANTSVEVRRGQVEVSDFKSGQIAQVMPGQVATAFAHGRSGLSLSGTGQFHPIEHGQPRASSIERIPVPKSGLSAPRDGANGRPIHAIGHGGTIGNLASASGPGRPTGANPAVKRNGVRISSALGEVKLNVRKATNGLAHGSETSVSGKQARTVWGDSQTSLDSAAASGQNSGASGMSSATNGAASAALASTASATSAAVSVAASGNGNGNGATGNGKGNGNNGNGNNGNGNNGNGNGNGNGGNGNGNGNGNGGNGNGNGGNGNGNGKGNGKH